MRKILPSFLALVLFTAPAWGMGSRTYLNAIRPMRLLAKQYAAGANVFPTADPSPAGTPLTKANAMGVASNDGVVTLCFTNGFTAPITLTCYYWQSDHVVPANSCWVRSGGSSALYAFSLDSQYSSISFSVPAETPFIVTSSAAVTGKVYCSANADPSNPGSTSAGY